MRAWGVKSKLGFLVSEDNNEYGTLLDAKLFKLKKDAKTYIKNVKTEVNYPETLAKIEIKEIK